MPARRRVVLQLELRQSAVLWSWCHIVRLLVDSIAAPQHAARPLLLLSCCQTVATAHRKSHVQPIDRLTSSLTIELAPTLQTFSSGRVQPCPTAMCRNASGTRVLVAGTVPQTAGACRHRNFLGATHQ